MSRVIVLLTDPKRQCMERVECVCVWVYERERDRGRETRRKVQDNTLLGASHFFLFTPKMTDKSKAFKVKCIDLLSYIHIYVYIYVYMDVER